jgi:hypothetical protein
MVDSTMLTKVYSDEVYLPESVLSAKIDNDLCEACALGKSTFDNQFE